MDEDDSSFVIDTSPTLQYDVDVPKYDVERKSKELQESDEKNTFKPRIFQNPNNVCWNCGKQTHSIRECDAQANPYTLEWNREVQNMSKTFQSKKLMKNAGRYHDTHQTSDKFTTIRPGPLSHRLRKVMGLAEYDLPSYIYRLRSHGYPAAWLRYATVKPSGINLYDKDGKEVADPNAEEGEIIEEEDKIRYDLTKLITFPGFNAPMPPDCVDNFEKYAVPPYNADQNLDHMIQELKKKAVTEYVLQKNLSKTKSPEDGADTETNMEIESPDISSDNLVPDIEEIPPTQQPEEVSTQSATDTDSLSNDISQDSLPESQDSPAPSNEKSSLGRILSSSEGTPLLRSKSGHSRLPPRENFSKDISDVINFENLPESTGTFERMRGLLKKVKSVLGLQKKPSSL